MIYVGNLFSIRPSSNQPSQLHYFLDNSFDPTPVLIVPAVPDIITSDSMHANAQSNDLYVTHPVSFLYPSLGNGNVEHLYYLVTDSLVYLIKLLQKVPISGYLIHKNT